MLEGRAPQAAAACHQTPWARCLFEPCDQGCHVTLSPAVWSVPLMHARAVLAPRHLVAQSLLSLHLHTLPPATHPAAPACLRYAFPAGRNMYAKPTERWAALIDPDTGAGLGAFAPHAWMGITAYRTGRDRSDRPYDTSYFAHTIRMALTPGQRPYNFTVRGGTGCCGLGQVNWVASPPGSMPSGRSTGSSDGHACGSTGGSRGLKTAWRDYLQLCLRRQLCLYPPCTTIGRSWRGLTDCYPPALPPPSPPSHTYISMHLGTSLNPFCLPLFATRIVLP